MVGRMARKPSSEAPFLPRFPGDRATAPGALEEIGETAWERFEELRQKQDRQFAPTEPGQRGAPDTASRAFQVTQPMAVQPDTPARSQQQRRDRAPLSLDEVMLVARRNNRACPLPGPWKTLYQKLLEQAPDARTAVPPPVDGPAWDAVSPMQKRLRLRDQLEWAERVGALSAVHAMLVALDEGEWLHF